MPIINIEKSIKKYISESVFTDDQINALYNCAKEACKINSENFKNCNEDADLTDTIAKMSVPAINAALTNFIKNRYGLNSKKLADQTKELNDLYTKVDDMIKHDKMARFKHRNDRINATTKGVYLKDNNDPRKLYKLQYDLMAFNPEWFIQEIDSAMEYIYQNGNKKEDVAKMHDSLMNDIESVYNKHEYISHFGPYVECRDYKNQKLEDCLMVYKDSFSNYYYSTAAINSAVETEMQYLQLCQQSYNKCIGKYGRDKNGKYIIEDVFKKALQYATMSIDFNNNIIDTITEVIRYYVIELEKIYEIIRS